MRQQVTVRAADVDQLCQLAERVAPGSIDNINTLAPLLLHAYAPRSQAITPQPRTPPPPLEPQPQRTDWIPGTPQEKELHAAVMTV